MESRLCAVDLFMGMPSRRSLFAAVSADLPFPTPHPAVLERLPFKSLFQLKHTQQACQDGASWAQNCSCTLNSPGRGLTTPSHTPLKSGVSVSKSKPCSPPPRMRNLHFGVCSVACGLPGRHRAVRPNATSQSRASVLHGIEPTEGCVISYQEEGVSQ